MVSHGGPSEGMVVRADVDVERLLPSGLASRCFYCPF